MSKSLTVKGNPLLVDLGYSLCNYGDLEADT